ncbi:MAG: polysaccharide deacetylase family protein [Candidatus Nanopelagicales bacterium]
MISVSTRVIALMGAGAFLLAGCGASVATSDEVADTASPSKASKKVDVASLGNELRAEAPGEVNPPAESDGLPPVVRSIKTEDKVVFITIDDGASADPKVMDIIRKTGIPVTPFLTKSEISGSKDYYKQISEMTGQKVQDHTISHPQMPGLSAEGQRKQICEPAASYTEWFGAKPWMFRPPYGEFNKVTQEAAKACGMDYIVMWNASLPKAYIRYAQGDKLKSGDIILTHWRPDLYKHLPRALKDIQQQGFKVAALQDYLPQRGE